MKESNHICQVCKDDIVTAFYFEAEHGTVVKWIRHDPFKVVTASSILPGVISINPGFHSIVGLFLFKQNWYFYWNLGRILPPSFI